MQIANLANLPSCIVHNLLPNTNSEVTSVFKLLKMIYHHGVSSKSIFVEKFLKELRSVVL